MTVYELLHAIGEADERFLEESERYSERVRIVKKFAVTAASIFLLMSLILIPVKNGTFGCASAEAPDTHEHMFYASISHFVKDVGKTSLLANLSYAENEITDFKMECIYYPFGHYLEQYYCSFSLVDQENANIRISFSDFDREKPEGETIVICGEDFIILSSDETQTKLYYDTPSGAYTITVNAEDHMAIALQVAEDLLTKE